MTQNPNTKSYATFLTLTKVKIITKQKRFPKIENLLLIFNLNYYFKLRISRASAEFATGRPNSFAKRTTLSTNSPLDFARTPLSK